MKISLKVPFVSRLRKRDRLLLGVTTVCLGIYFLASLFIIPRARRYGMDRTLIEEQEKVLEGYLDTLAKEKGFQRQLAALETKAKSYDRFLLKADKAPLAAAELQNQVKEAAGQRGLDIVSERIATPTKGDYFVNIPVEVTANGGIAALRDFLYTVETGQQPVLTIPEINIRTSKKRSFDPVAKKYVELEELQSTILINGMMKSEP